MREGEEQAYGDRLYLRLLHGGDGGFQARVIERRQLSVGPIRSSTVKRSPRGRGRADGPAPGRRARRFWRAISSTSLKPAEVRGRCGRPCVRGGRSSRPSCRGPGRRPRPPRPPRLRWRSLRLPTGRRGGGDLGGQDPTASEHHEVGESTADVDPESRPIFHEVIPAARRPAAVPRVPPRRCPCGRSHRPGNSRVR